MVSVPEPVQRVFEQFPLYRLPEATLPEKTDQKPGINLYIYNVDSDGYATEPECLQAQAILTLLGEQPRVVLSSQHATDTGRLPYAVDTTRKRIRVYPTINAILHNRLSIDSETEIYANLVQQVVRNAWIISILQPSNSAKMAELYLPETERTELPALALWFTKSEVHASLTERLKASFPGYVDSSRSWLRSTQATDYAEEALARADEALRALSSHLDTNLFFPVGQRVNDSAAGVLDVLVYGFVRPITRSLAGTQLETLVPDNLREHANRVHDAITSA